MLDLHCHILPGIDDGARNLTESIDMARLAVSEGITHILATPHHLNRNWINKKEDVLELVTVLQKELINNDIPLTILPAQEIRIAPHLLEDIQLDEILILGSTYKYLLIEFPTKEVPGYTDRIFLELREMDITPIIVHPERNHELANTPTRLKELVENGALAQLTSASLIGNFGKKIQKTSKDFIEADLIHFVASDAHNVTNRSFYMSEAKDYLIKNYGAERWNQYDRITRAILNGDKVIAPQPQIRKKKRFLGLF